jgi:hypothetical protein
MGDPDRQNATQAYFETRFAHDPRREILWQTLYRCYFSRLIPESDSVLELGAGYCHFINNVAAKRRIALDAWDGFVQYLRPGIESRIGNVSDLSFLAPRSVNFAFASNLFEHISQDELALVLEQLHTVLADQGTINILQPNYYYAYREYFDDYTHRTIYTHTSMCNFLEAHDYRVIECRPRFLPLTVKSRLPVSPLLIQIYLALPFKPMGKQMLIRAQPA